MASPHTQPYTEKLLHILAQQWLSCCLYVACKLNIADILQEGPKSLDDLAITTGTHAPSLYRVLRALAGEGFFEETPSGEFKMTEAAVGLTTNAPGTMKQYYQLCMGELYAPWGALLYSTQTGNASFNHVYQMDLWEYYTKHPDDALNFMESMTRLTQFTDQAVVAAYDFTQFNSIVDVGGGNGELLMAALNAAPNLQGIVYDQPYVAEQTKIAIAARGLSHRGQAQGGDFFESVPAGADAYMMKLIMHDWHEHDALRILKNCSNAMKSGSKLLVIDAVIPPANIPHRGKLMDITMLTVTGGKERTAEEFKQLYEAAGLQFNKVIDLAVHDVSIVEGEKL
ncbi:methyltransferase [Chitinophaga sp. Cy-1792]|uniref:methyltransferase n=1 Tax=Chitinophaga sp. Cy-1792 TaxID=2608339 RepID=UPI00142281BA|nr:methyltransferase [Chitinophaga sp. Cy-1792]NIG56522.1 methyltransferase [Chitinophaga sp. Cy-1792]